jgi:hypothetical protein
MAQIVRLARGGFGQRKVHSAIGGRQITAAEAERGIRSREHLAEREVEQLIESVKNNRWGHRDATGALGSPPRLTGGGIGGLSLPLRPIGPVQF